MQETECRKCAGCDWQAGGDLAGCCPVELGLALVAYGGCDGRAFVQSNLFVELRDSADEQCWGQ